MRGFGKGNDAQKDAIAKDEMHRVEEKGFRHLMLKRLTSRAEQEAWMYSFLILS